MLRLFPLLAIPAVVYALFALPVGAEGMRNGLASPALTMGLPSGVQWIVSRGQALTMLSVLCLFLEIVKSTRPTTSSMIDNTLAVGVFVLCLLAFMLIPSFGTTEFFLISMMCVLDFVAGFVVMISTARRTVDYPR